MSFGLIIFFTLIAYFIGSVPVAWLFAKVRYGINLSHHGNGIPSHTNLGQLIHPSVAVYTRLMDISKGFLATSLAAIAYRYGFISEVAYPVLSLSLGLSAVIGHLFPMFTAFQGPRALHVTVGVMLFIYPWGVFYTAIILAIAYALWHYRSPGWATALLLLIALWRYSRILDGSVALLYTGFLIALTGVSLYIYRRHTHLFLRIVEQKLLRILSFSVFRLPRRKRK